MSNNPQPVSSYNPPPQATKSKGWFARNWWWFIPLIIIAPFVCCCGSCGGLMYFGLQEIDKLPPYQDTLQAANNNPEVQAELGTPLEPAGIFDTISSGGNFDYAQTGTTETLSASRPVTGPKGSGTLRIEASTSGGVWTYTVREIEVNSSGNVIDLMPAASPSDPANAEDADVTTP